MLGRITIDTKAVAKQGIPLVLFNTDRCPYGVLLDNCVIDPEIHDLALRVIAKVPGLFFR